MIIGWISKLIGGDRQDKKKIAIYNEQKIFVFYLTETYALVSYNEDGSKKFKLNLEDLK